MLFCEQQQDIVSDVGTYQFVIPSAWKTHARQLIVPRARCGATRCPMRGRRQMSPRRSRVSRSCLMKSTRGSNNSARRALLVLSAVSVRNGEHELGIQHAADALSAEPFDEMACQALMRAHAVAGSRAEALRVYANCRKLFRDELGAEPSEQTAAVFLSILRAE